MVQITKSHYFGTREELDALYGKETLDFIYVPTGTPADINVFWDSSTKFTDVGVWPSLDFMYAFIDGQLSIESMGITYKRTIGDPYTQTLFDVAVWDAPESLWQKSKFKPIVVDKTSLYDVDDWDDQTRFWGVLE